MSFRTRFHRRKLQKHTRLWFLLSLTLLVIFFFLLSPLVREGAVSQEPNTAAVIAGAGTVPPPGLMQVEWGASPEVVQALSIINERLEDFPKQVEARLKMVPIVNEINRSCHFVYPLSTNITRYEYGSGVSPNRSLETPQGLLNVIKQRSSDDVFLFSGALPAMIKQTPVVLSETFDITKPFGKWKLFFRDPPFKYYTHTMASASDFYDKSLSNETLQLVRGLYSGVQYQSPQPPMYVATFPNAVISVGHVITCDGSVYTAGGCVKHWYLPDINESEQIDWRVVAIPFCDGWCVAYFHFTHDHLPRLAPVYKVLMEREDAVLVLQTGFRSFQTQWLTDVLGIPSSRILYSKIPVHGRLVLYPMPEVCAGVFSHLLYTMRGIVFKRLHLTPPPPVNERKLHLFFAERNELSRMPSNYYSLKEKIILEYNDVFTFSDNAVDMNVSEQVRAFYRADIVLGPHGANLANLMWMRNGTHLIEIMSYIDGNMCYHTTASKVNVTHHIVFHNATKNGQYLLEYDYLKRHIDFAINAFKKN